MDRQTRMYDSFDRVEQKTIEEILTIVYDALEKAICFDLSACSAMETNVLCCSIQGSGIFTFPRLPQLTRTLVVPAKVLLI